MSEKINFSEFIDQMSEKTGRSKEQIHHFLKGIVDTTRYGLEQDNRVHMNGLGIFDLRFQNARMGRNPQTGEEIEIPEHYRVHFHPDASMRKFINRKYAHLKPRLLPGEKGSGLTLSNNATVEPVIADQKSGKPKKHPVWMWGLAILLVIFLLFFILPLDEQTSVVNIDLKNENTGDGLTEQAGPGSTVTSPNSVSDKTRVTSEIRFHVIENGDRLWDLSDEFYKNAFFWPYLYKINQAVIPNPDWLTPGASIAAPALAGNLKAMSAEQRQVLADGYMQAYFNYRKRGHENAYTYLWAAEKIGGETLINTYKSQIAISDLNRLKDMRHVKPVFAVTY